MNTRAATMAILVSRQRACVRALTDEIIRSTPMGLRAAGLREQLLEEEARLADLLTDPAAA